jgi:hypothetical protein
MNGTSIYILNIYLFWGTFDSEFCIDYFFMNADKIMKIIHNEEQTSFSLI